ncbi:uncharacterized [Tachysurus ichikawai]
MLCSTQRLSIITLCHRSLPPPTPKATQKNGSQPSGLSCKEDLDLQYPAVQGDVLLDQRVIQARAKSINNHRSLPIGPSWRAKKVQAKGR